MLIKYFFSLLVCCLSCCYINNAQIKDFLDDTDKKAKATNQVSLDNDEYYGYYHNDSQAYKIEQIFISK